MAGPLPLDGSKDDEIYHDLEPILNNALGMFDVRNKLIAEINADIDDRLLNINLRYLNGRQIHSSKRPLQNLL